MIKKKTKNFDSSESFMHTSRIFKSNKSRIQLNITDEKDKELIQKIIDDLNSFEKEAKNVANMISKTEKLRTKLRDDLTNLIDAQIIGRRSAYSLMNKLRRPYAQAVFDL